MTAVSLSRSAPEGLAGRVALALGTVVLANVAVEAAMAVVAGNPFAPPFATPGSRFLLFAAGIPRLAQIIGGVGLLTVGCMSLANHRTQKNLGIAFLVLSAAALAPIAFVLADFGAAASGLPQGGLVRIRIQLARVILLYATLAGAFWTAGRLLLTRSRQA